MPTTDQLFITVLTNINLVKLAELILITLTSLMEAYYCNNLIVSTIFGVSLLFARLRFCHDQATCFQLEVLGQANGHAVTKKVVCMYMYSDSSETTKRTNTKLCTIDYHLGVNISRAFIMS